MSNHLPTCKKRLQILETAEKQSQAQTKKWLHLVITGRRQTDYWLHLETDASKKLRDLDQFLRSIWLECCGHLSHFAIDQQNYSVHPTQGYGEHSMNITLDSVLRPGMTFRHEYDYGTTTELELKVISRRKGAPVAKNRWLVIMARNDPPQIMCDRCGQKLAVVVCSYCIWGEQEAWLCADCKAQHPCCVREKDEYMLLPVVNSPRVGMCGYTGPEL